MSDTKNENQNNTCQRDDREHSPIGAGRTSACAQTNQVSAATEQKQLLPGSSRTVLLWISFCRTENQHTDKQLLKRLKGETQVISVLIQCW